MSAATILSATPAAPSLLELPSHPSGTSAGDVNYLSNCYWLLSSWSSLGHKTLLRSSLNRRHTANYWEHSIASEYSNLARNQNVISYLIEAHWKPLSLLTREIWTKIYHYSANDDNWLAKFKPTGMLTTLSYNHLGHLLAAHSIIAFPDLENLSLELSHFTVFWSPVCKKKI